PARRSGRTRPRTAPPCPSPAAPGTARERAPRSIAPRSSGPLSSSSFSGMPPYSLAAGRGITRPRDGGALRAGRFSPREEEPEMKEAVVLVRFLRRDPVGQRFGVAVLVIAWLALAWTSVGFAVAV